MKDTKALREMNRQDLVNLYTEMRKKLYNLNVATNHEDFKPHQYKLFKKTIARVLTVMNEVGDKK